MPTFMDSLAANPQGSGIYGQPGQNNNPQDPLALVNRIKDREMLDYKDKATFAANLEERQRLRAQNLFPPQSASQSGQPQNTVMAPDPNQMTGYQKGELGIRQQDANTESQRLTQQGQMGEQALGIKSDQEKLNQQKSDQINVEKQKELQAKTDEANKKLTLAQQALSDKTKTADEQIQAHKDLAAAVEERHKLEMDTKQHEFDVTSDQHKQQIADMQKKLDQQSHTQTTTELDASGNKKTVTTDRGSSDSSDDDPLGIR